MHVQRVIGEGPQRQVYLGSEEFVERHSPEDQEFEEIPRAQLRPIKPGLERISAKDAKTGSVQTYREYGYKLQERGSITRRSAENSRK